VPGDVDRTPETRAGAEAEGLGVDAFAQRCGTTVRMVREYQTLGVLPPPTKVGRNAFYGPEHVARWEAVGRLQERGYSLAAIADLFRAWTTGSSLPSVLGVEGAPVGALDETPVIVDAAELEAELPAVFTRPGLVRRAVKAGLVHRHGDARYAVRSPALVRLVADAVAAGIPPGRALDLVEAIDAHTADIARSVLGVLDASIASYEEPAHADLLRRGRPLLAQAVASTVVHHIGAQLAAAAEDRPDVAELIADLRIGAVNDTTIRPKTKEARP
jgi:DNA-binding transcriptional MerR regulator